MSFKISVYGHIPEVGQEDGKSKEEIAEVESNIEEQTKGYTAALERLGARDVQVRWEYSQSGVRVAGTEIKEKKETS